MSLFNRTDLLFRSILEDILRQKESSWPGTPLHLPVSCARFAAPLPVYCRLVAGELRIDGHYLPIMLPAGRFDFQLQRNLQGPLYDPSGLELCSIGVMAQRYS